MNNGKFSGLIKSFVYNEDVVEPNDKHVKAG